LHKKDKKDKSLSVAGTRTNKLNERNKDANMVKQKLKRKRHENDVINNCVFVVIQLIGLENTCVQ